MNNENKVKISENLENIKNLLEIPQNSSSIKAAWYVGAAGNDSNGIYTDFASKYIHENRWENRNDSFIDQVKSMQVGDYIALKASYTRKKDLPFDNNGQSVSVMGLKAIGMITDNPKDGKNISVEWKEFSSVREWYGPMVLRRTVHLVQSSDGSIAQQLLDFTFNGIKQDYSMCEELYKTSELLQDEIKIVDADIVNDMSIEELGKILTSMYNNADNKTTAIHMFGIKYGPIIRKHKYSPTDIVAASDVGESYHVEVGKGVRIYESILNNEYGIKFYEGTEHATLKKQLPVFQRRTRKLFPLNCILYGAPGTGKTYTTTEYALAISENKKVEDISAEDRSKIMHRYNELIENGQIVFTTFHQNYGYEDFIQGIRPDTSTKEMSFRTVDGVFKVIADRALKDPNKDYVIIIDEINRANISKVFGELITLIEDDKRWGEKNAISAILPSGDIFVVPNNLYIIGTMNSADKSISLIDTAIRRRFNFIEYVPNLQLVSDAKLRKVMEALNKGIAAELKSTDLLIGHTYFMEKTADDLCDIMNRSVIPLLYEYFFDNHKKVEAQIKNAIESMDVKIKSSSMGRIKLIKKDDE